MSSQERNSSSNSGGGGGGGSALAAPAPAAAPEEDNISNDNEGTKENSSQGTADANRMATAVPADVRSDDGGAAGDEEDEEGQLGPRGSSEERDEEVAEQDLYEQVASNDVKNIILQVLSPYFDDDGTAETGEDGEDAAQRYDHVKSLAWIQLICDGIQERLIGMGKPYKYVVHCMVMRKCGAGMHVCSSCLYGQNDGWVSHAHDLSAHIYSVVTVYWSAI